MKNLIQAAVVTLFAASAAQAQQAVQWKVSEGGNGHWYQVVVVAPGSSWISANSAAAARNGYLASVQSSTEATFVWLLANATAGAFTSNPGGNEVGPWLGATRILGTNDWQWTSGEPFGFTQWCSGEPNGGSSEPHMHLMRNGATSCWNDRENNAFGVGNPGFVIEWSTDCNSDGIVDYGQCRDGTTADYNSNNTPDCCERGEACVVGNYPVQWRVEDGGNGHWYRFVELGDACFDWWCSYAASHGAHPLTIGSAAEQALASGTLPTTYAGFIGGFRDPGSDVFSGWKWVTGEPFLYSAISWADGNPGCCADEEYALLLLPNGIHDGRLCVTRTALLEWDADCNADGFVDYGQILRGQLIDANSNGIPDICQQPTCVDADIYRDFNVNGADLGILLSQWGPNTPLTESDLNSDGVVNGADLGIMLSFWGACP